MALQSGRFLAVQKFLRKFLTHETKECDGSASFIIRLILLGLWVFRGIQWQSDLEDCLQTGNSRGARAGQTAPHFCPIQSVIAAINRP